MSVTAQSMPQGPSLPQGPLVTWYGDDFTGSAAVMEVLSFAGLPSVLFLKPPSAAQLARFAGMRGIGIAGIARARSPEWMERELPTVFDSLASLNAPIMHYKVCSTLDSSVTAGSIGTAIDIAQSRIQSKWVPLLIAAPAIRRYQCFGHLFAAAQDGVFRLDRHPVMALHPVTPMDESDVRLHLQKQMSGTVGLIDLVQLSSSTEARAALAAALAAAHRVVALDTVDMNTLTASGQLIWETRNDGLFCVGSQGIEYALVAYWQQQGMLEASDPPDSAGRVEQLVVVSGSVSSVTASQINWSLTNGFAGIAFNVVAAAQDDAALEQAISTAVSQACDAARQGQDVLVYSARGVDDPAVHRYREALEQFSTTSAQGNERIGIALGRVLEQVLQRTGARRAVIAGGDTSGHATQVLGIDALTALAPTIPGAALFHAHSDNPHHEGLEIALKGGQMGTEDYFGWIKHGGGDAYNRRTNT